MTTERTHEEIDGPAPACFTPEQWRHWVKCERELLKSNRYHYNENGFCAECTPRYKKQMVERGQCSYPTVTFIRDADGSLNGVREKT